MLKAVKLNWHILFPRQGHVKHHSTSLYVKYTRVTTSIYPDFNLGKIPIYLQIIAHIISSLPPAIDNNLISLHWRLILHSGVQPIPPQYWRHLSETSRHKRPPFSLAMEARRVTSCPSIIASVNKISLCKNLCYSGFIHTLKDTFPGVI